MKIKKLFFLGLPLLMLPLVGCDDPAAGKTKLDFWIYGDADELNMYRELVNRFNETYGEEHSIYVATSTKPAGSSYLSLIQYTASSRSGPDIFFTIENEFKKWVDMDICADITEEFNNVTDIDVSDIYDSVVRRLRYNPQTNSSEPGEPQYGYPLDVQPTALFYNETFFNNMGITVISVDEEDMDAWNNNEIPDRRGNKKSDLGINYKVPKKGFYRSMNPYVDGYGWSKPSSLEKMVFNNRIAMNWDEVEDLGMLFTPSYNNEAKEKCSRNLEYGYFTEWWFNYGWSIGGDCIEDLTGTGEYNFGLLDAEPNYMVNTETYTGAFTDTVYHKGEILDIKDKYNLQKGQHMEANATGGYVVGGTEIHTRPQVLNDVSAGTLTKLPSIRDAFGRYLKLGINKDREVEGAKGLSISPNPSIFNNRSVLNYFYSGNIAFVAQTSAYVSSVAKQSQAYEFQWDVAPLARYKEYSDPFDPDCDTVVALGLKAGHSNSKSLCTRDRCAHKQEVAAFIKWMASKNGQSLKAQLGYFPNQPELVDSIVYKGNAPRNVQAFADALSYQGPGDWWYLPNYTWVEIWANPLNYKVRNSLMDYADWKLEAIPQTNEELRNKYWKNNRG